MKGLRPRPQDPVMLAVGGLEVRVRVAGEGEPLLLLNGLTRPLESWEPFTHALNGRTIVSFDAPGVGGSPTPVLPLSMTRLATVAAFVLDAAGFDAADVLGFSHGGAVAQQLAIDAPARVRRLVLASTSCGVGAIPGRDDALRRLGGPSEAPSWPGGDAIGAIWHSLAISTWSSIGFLGAIRAPTLVVCGTRDRVVPPANSALLAQRIPGADLVLLPAGHDLQRRGPASAFAGAVESFLGAAQVVEPLAVDS